MVCPYYTYVIGRANPAPTEDPSLTLPKGREYMLVGASFMGAFFLRHGLRWKHGALRLI